MILVIILVVPFSVTFLFIFVTILVPLAGVQHFDRFIALLVDGGELGDG